MTEIREKPEKGAKTARNGLKNATFGVSDEKSRLWMN